MRLVFWLVLEWALLTVTGVVRVLHSDSDGWLMISGAGACLLAADKLSEGEGGGDGHG